MEGRVPNPALQAKRNDGGMENVRTTNQSNQFWEREVFQYKTYAEAIEGVPTAAQSVADRLERAVTKNGTRSLTKSRLEQLAREAPELSAPASPVHNALRRPSMLKTIFSRVQTGGDEGINLIAFSPCCWKRGI